VRREPRVPCSTPCGTREGRWIGRRILVPTAAMAEGVAPVGNDASAAKTLLLRAAQREALH